MHDLAAPESVETAPALFAEYQAELRLALLIRRTEERLLQLFSEGKLFGTVHTCIGQEFSAVAVGRVLDSHDIVFSNHRGHGHFLACGGEVAALIAEVSGKATGQCGGRGGSQHLHRGRYYSNGVQGGIVPVAAGLAMAEKLRGTNAIAVVFLGDGTLGEGAVYETMNIASKWDLPLLMVCENNGFAQSTDQQQTLAGDICGRASAFGIEHYSGNTTEWCSLFSTVEAAACKVRQTSRPCFLRVDTFRLMAHSKGDDTRDPDFVKRHWDLDPLARLCAGLKDNAAWQSMSREVDRIVDSATDAANVAEFAPPPSRPPPFPATAWEPITFEPEKVAKSIYRGLASALESDSRVLLLGEDIEGPYGGAFKCTRDLSIRFPGRVRNTPISELGITGIGNGLALGGMRPVIEIMFGDFVTLAVDQWINHSGKFQEMFNDSVEVPLIIRTPMGGKRGYGATHSQSLERHIVGVPGTRVLCLHHRFPPAALYGRLFAATKLPTMVIENKILYGHDVRSTAPPGFTITCTKEQFPTVRLAADRPADVTVVALGGMSLEAETAMIHAFVEDEIVVDLFLPTALYPFNAECLIESVRQTRRVVVAEEGQGFASVGAEIVAALCEMRDLRIDAVERVSAEPQAIPAARPLEAFCLPGVEQIHESIRRVML